MISKSEYKLLKAIKKKVPLDNVSATVYESLIKNGYVYFYDDCSAELLPKGEGAMQEYFNSFLGIVISIGTLVCVFGSLIIGVVALVLNKS